VRRRFRAEASGLKVGEALHDLLLVAHDKWTVLHNGLANRRASDEEKACKIRKRKIKSKKEGGVERERDETHGGDQRWSRGS